MSTAAASTSFHEQCRVCGSASPYVFSQKLLSFEVRYFDCAVCGYLQTEQPHWLAQAYAQPINDVDTGILVRNHLNVDRVLMTLAALGRLHGRVVDHAGGYGVLVRLLRDAGVDARWRDRYCANLLARGFEDDGAPCDLLTAFEVFEHLVDPLADLRSMLGDAPAVLLSTDLVPSLRPALPGWWYLGSEHGQHIGFFRVDTLRMMAREAGCHVATDGRGLHLFSRQPVPTAWRPLIALRRLAPVLARTCLEPRTQADYHWLSERRSATS